MDGWMVGKKEESFPSLCLSGCCCCCSSLSFPERQSIIGDVDQYSRSAPSSIGLLMHKHNPNLLQWQKWEADVSFRRTGWC